MCPHGRARYAAPARLPARGLGLVNARAMRLLSFSPVDWSRGEGGRHGAARPRAGAAHARPAEDRDGRAGVAARGGEEHHEPAGDCVRQPVLLDAREHLVMDGALLVEMLRRMLLIRLFDQTAAKLLARG